MTLHIKQSWSSAGLAGLLALIAMIRILSSYSHTAQAFDEPIHVGAAMELLDRGTYTSDPVHPPLARIAIGLPLYFAGERYPATPLPNLNAVGDAILNDSGRYLHNLGLARLGVLPFFLLGCGVVFLWARREYGEFAAVMAVAMFTTLPNVLAFSSIAYTDIVAASTQTAALWAVATWLDRPGNWTAVGMGAALGLALMAKATTCIYLPVCALAMLGLKWAGGDLSSLRTLPGLLPGRQAIKQLTAAGLLAIGMVWAGYGFAIGRVDESMGLSASAMPSFQHFPSAVGKISRAVILSDPRIPAPALIRGLATAWVLNKTHPPAYLFGRIREGGWWYFFLVGIAVKATIPLLAFAAVGCYAAIRRTRPGRWTALTPVVSMIAILLVTMPVKYNAGVRHILVVFPLLSMIAGCGCSYLWNLLSGRIWARGALIGLLAWQLVSTTRASGDYLAYFNELAGNDPSKILAAGCDLDCGQDLFALARELRSRNISHTSLALWTSADMGKMGLPDFDIPLPYQPVTGWFAISLRALRFGNLFHTTYPPDAFAWLSRYQPVARVGKTILLYYIPPQASGSNPR